jgi:transposase
MPPSAVLLFEDETELHLFPVLRRSWSLKGQQARIDVTGENGQRVLFGSIDVRSGHRIIMQHPKLNQQSFQAYLRLLHRCYPSRPVWVVLDKATAHTASNSQALAESLGITLIWLPRQCSELNAMDHLWRNVKKDISANFQYSSILEHADFAETYILNLTRKQAQRRAGILSKNFWLKSFLK